MRRQNADGFRSRCVRWFRVNGLMLGVLLLAAATGHAGVLTASWMAPTTNTDGSALTQLAFYRLYYSTSDTPCPGTTYFEVASSTSTPPPDQWLSVQLTGLTTGWIYSVSVTAVDSSGNASSCSDVASAIARDDSATVPVQDATTPTAPVQEATLPVQDATTPIAPADSVAGSITWSNPVNVTVAGGSLTKSAGCDGCYDAGAVSQQQITGASGYAQFTAGATGPLRLAGLAQSFSVANASSIAFGIRLQGATAEVRELGVYRTDVSFAAGDVFRISVQGGMVSYAKNGTVFYTSSVAPSSPLAFAVDFADLNGAIGSAVLADGL